VTTMGHLHGWFRVGTASQCRVNGEPTSSKASSVTGQAVGIGKGGLNLHSLWHAVQRPTVEARRGGALRRTERFAGQRRGSGRAAQPPSAGTAGEAEPSAARRTAGVGACRTGPGCGRHEQLSAGRHRGPYRAAHIEQRWSVSYGLSSVSRLLHRMSLSWQTTRPAHPKGDAEAQELNKKPRGHAGGDRGRPPRQDAAAVV